MASNGGALQVVLVDVALHFLLCLGGSIHIGLANNRSVSLSSSFVWGENALSDFRGLCKLKKSCQNKVRKDLEVI